MWRLCTVWRKEYYFDHRIIFQWKCAKSSAMWCGGPDTVGNLACAKTTHTKICAHHNHTQYNKHYMNTEYTDLHTTLYKTCVSCWCVKLSKCSHRNMHRRYLKKHLFNLSRSLLSAPIKLRLALTCDELAQRLNRRCGGAVVHCWTSCFGIREEFL